MYQKHAWNRNGAWGYQCLRCGLSTGRTFDDLPTTACCGKH